MGSWNVISLVGASPLLLCLLCIVFFYFMLYAHTRVPRVRLYFFLLWAISKTRWFIDTHSQFGEKDISQFGVWVLPPRASASLYFSSLDRVMPKWSLLPSYSSNFEVIKELRLSVEAMTRRIDGRYCSIDRQVDNKSIKARELVVAPESRARRHHLLPVLFSLIFLSIRMHEAVSESHKLRDGENTL